MKKLIPLAVLLAGIAGASAQTVDFNNFRTYATPADRDVYNVNGTDPLVGTQFMAQLYYGASAASLNAVTTAPARFRNLPTSDPFAGTWSGGTRTLTGFNPGDVVTLQVRAWDGTGGATYDTAGVRGASATFTYRIPTGGNPPPTDFYLENLRSFAVVVPEPSVIALGVIGAGALFMLRRRK